jgi:hypothetical protein
MPRLTPKQARLYVRLQQIKIAEERLEAIQAFETTGGELPTLDLQAIEAEAIEIEAVKVTAETEKATLEAEATKLDGEATKIDGGKNPAEKDAKLAEGEAVAKEIESKEQYLASLEQQKLELEFQERLAKSELTKEDEAEVAKRKEALARDIEEKRAALRAKKLLDDPLAAERLANRARIKATLELKLA